MRVFKEFERVCDKYINMFELYCEQNILMPRYKDSKVFFSSTLISEGFSH